MTLQNIFSNKKVLESPVFAFSMKTKLLHTCTQNWHLTCPVLLQASVLLAATVIPCAACRLAQHPPALINAAYDQCIWVA